jgi:hypothetical protein
VAETDDATALVETANVAVVLPTATVTAAGTVADALLLDSETDTPPEGAAPLKVTVPVAAVPPVTLEGLSEMDERARLANGVMVSAGEEYIVKHILPGTQLGRLIKPEQIADAICFMISNSAVTGELWADADWHPAAA